MRTTTVFPSSQKWVQSNREKASVLRHIWSCSHFLINPEHPDTYSVKFGSQSMARRTLKTLCLLHHAHLSESEATSATALALRSEASPLQRLQECLLKAFTPHTLPTELGVQRLQLSLGLSAESTDIGGQMATASVYCMGLCCVQCNFTVRNGGSFPSSLQ